ncbi:MAG: 16S rRNA (cytosine(967)-C(5))-methyltransferase RsmB [Clostridia bacterium]|nr:16S rRNA (cytosine(967)-C(5))-methyltransferase RsmB [Clostridia bacterium]
MTAREAALKSLCRIEKEGRYSNLEADLILKGGELSEKDRALYTRLVYGTIERKITLDYLLSGLTEKPFEKTDPGVKNLLRLSAYQILYADRIPDSAAVNEGVELCKRYYKGAHAFVNALLRRLTREKQALAFPDKSKDPVLYLSVFYSVSPSICALFLEQYGLARCETLFEAMNKTPATTLRINTVKSTVEDFLAGLQARGIDYAPCALAPYGVRVNAPVSKLTELEEGLCFVQDEASQLCVQALQAKPGMTVIDCCACPGGKSFGAAIAMENEGGVLSFDLHENKLSLIRTGAQRMGLSIIRAEAADASKCREDLIGKADVLLLDAPCSGLGVLSKKPELRYKEMTQTERLPEIQQAILENACNYLKKGGRLIYSTCTLLKRENEERYFDFLSHHPEFEEAPLGIPGAQDASHLTLFPDIHGTDGFFISAMRKKD